MARKSKIIGAHSLEKALLELGKPSSLVAPVGRASRKALRPLLRAAKANTPHARVKKALTIRKDGSSPRNQPIYAVGGNPKDPNRRLLHLLEFGVAPHKIGNIDHPGHAAQPFLTPAFEAHADEVLKEFGMEIEPEIKKQAARIGRKHRAK